MKESDLTSYLRRYGYTGHGSSEVLGMDYRWRVTLVTCRVDLNWLVVFILLFLIFLLLIETNPRTWSLETVTTCFKISRLYLLLSCILLSVSCFLGVRKVVLPVHLHETINSPWYLINNPPSNYRYCMTVRTRSKEFIHSRVLFIYSNLHKESYWLPLALRCEG